MSRRRCAAERDRGSRVREPTVASGNLTCCGELVICRRTPASGRGQRRPSNKRGVRRGDDDGRSRISEAGRDRGLLEPRQDARAAADHPALVRPRRAHPRQGIHPGAGRVRLPGHGDGEGDQPLLLRLLPPDPGRGGDRAADGALPREARQQGAHGRQDVGGGVEARGHRQERPAEDRRLVGAVRRRARRQARRAHRVDDPSVVDPRARQLRPPLEQRVLRPLRQGGAAGGADRGVPPAAGVPHDVGRRGPGPVGARAAPSSPARRSRSSSTARTGRSCWPPSTRATRVGTSAASSTSSSSTTAGATTRCTTSPTCRGGRTPPFRWATSGR